MHSRSGKTADFPAHSPGMRAYAYVFGGRPAMNVRPPGCIGSGAKAGASAPLLRAKARHASISEHSRAIFSITWS